MTDWIVLNSELIVASILTVIAVVGILGLAWYSFSLRRMLKKKHSEWRDLIQDWERVSGQRDRCQEALARIKNIASGEEGVSEEKESNSVVRTVFE